jgi:hypothetical protein
MNPDNYDQYVANLLYKKLHGLVINRSILFTWLPNRATFDISLKEDVEANEKDLRDDFSNGQQLVLNFIAVKLR